MSANTEPLGGAFGAFPLGEYKGNQENNTGLGNVRPFGLRFAVCPLPAASAPVVDFSTWTYDAERQIAVVNEAGQRIDATKHSTGPTQTPTNTGDGTRFERDDDVTED